MTTIRLVLSIVAAEKLHLEQLDVKTAFLHGDLNEDIYMAQPEGFKVVGKENWVCKLKKSLYGLKPAPRQWYMKFNNFMDFPLTSYTFYASELWSIIWNINRGGETLKLPYKKV